MNNEINNDVSKSRGKYLHNMAFKFFILSLICAVICIPSYIFVDHIENSQIKNIVIFLYKGSFIIGIVSAIVWYIIDYIANKLYCPHCYTKGYKIETIKQKKIRSYTKRVKGSELESGLRHGYDLNTIYNIHVEDWEFMYKHDCCGYEYTEKKQLQIRTDTGQEAWTKIEVIEHK